MKKFVAVSLFIIAIAALAGCNTSGAGKKSAEGTTEDIYMEADLEPVKLEASEYVELGDYKGMTVEVEKEKVTDEEVQDEINGTLQGNVDYKEIEDRDTVQAGDFVEINYTSTIAGKKNKDYSDTNYEVKVGDGDLDENLGFGLGDDFKAEEKVIGAKVGEPVTVEFTFPKDYLDESVAGKKCKMEIVVQKISQEVLPTLEEYLKKYEKGVTVEQKTDEIRKYLEEEAADAAEGMANEELWTKIVNNAKQKKDFTKEMIEQEKEILLNEMAFMVEATYGMSVEDYAKEVLHMTMDEYAAFSLKAQCVEDLLIEAEKIKVTDEEIKKEKEALVKEGEYESLKDVSEDYTDEEFREGLATEKLMDKLISYNKIIIKEGEAKSKDKTEQAEEATTEAGK